MLTGSLTMRLAALTVGLAVTTTAVHLTGTLTTLTILAALAGITTLTVLASALTTALKSGLYPQTIRSSRGRGYKGAGMTLTNDRCPIPKAWVRPLPWQVRVSYPTLVPTQRRPSTMKWRPSSTSRP